MIIRPSTEILCRAAGTYAATVGYEKSDDWLSYNRFSCIPDNKTITELITQGKLTYDGVPKE
jgi:hypothetical protein